MLKPSILSVSAEYKRQQGQVGLIIILMMVVLLTIGVSLASRSVIQQETSIEQEEATTVFNSAETAIEQALHEIFEAERSGSPVTPYGQINTGDGFFAIESKEELEMEVERETSIEIPLDSSIGAGNTLDIEWDTSSGSCTNSAAIIVMVVNDGGGSDYSARYEAYDGCASRRSNNRFASPTGVSSDYNNQQDIALQTNDVLVRIMPIYNHTSLHISGNDIDSAQYIVEGRGLKNTTAQSIDVNRTMSAAPAFMDFALVNGSGVLTAN
mgnify:CR=1 FL=1